MKQIAFPFEGHRVAVFVAGSGPPMVFVHNAGNDHTIWLHQLEHFQKTHTVYGLDLLGFGASDAPLLAYDLALITRVVAAFVDTLDAPVLVGNCIGAAAILQATLQKPTRAKAIVLFHLATGATLLSSSIGTLIKTRRWFPFPSVTFDPIAKRLNRIGIIRRRIQRMGYAVAPPATDPIFSHVAQLGDDPKQLVARYSSMLHAQSYAVLDAVTRPAAFVPTALFWGTKNRTVSMQAGREFAQRFHVERFVELPNAGHMAMGEVPELVNRELEAFLSR